MCVCVQLGKRSGILQDSENSAGQWNWDSGVHWEFCHGVELGIVTVSGFGILSGSGNWNSARQSECCQGVEWEFLPGSGVELDTTLSH